MAAARRFLSGNAFRHTTKGCVVRSSLRFFGSHETLPWNSRMPDRQFEFMRDILNAPSPVGFESSMTEGVILPYFAPLLDKHGWDAVQFKGNSGLVIDTAPGRTDMHTVMIVGHCDKIRMQVRHVSKDGKIYIDSDSFLPGTLLGNEVTIFSRDGSGYKAIKGGTVEAHGAIHFVDAGTKTGKDDLYIELGLSGTDRKDQVIEAGIRAGDPVLLDRPIKRSFGENAFSGAYLDNGLGCFVTAETARLMAEYLSKGNSAFKNVRVLFAFASHEEIGRFGSRVLASTFSPDVLIGVDVNHDYVGAPNVGKKRFPDIEMGKGVTICTGSITSPALNNMLEDLAAKHDIPVQFDVRGRDTGTDAMAGVLASIDTVATSVGFPIRNMHTVSECGNTSDVLASIHLLHNFLLHLEHSATPAESWKQQHPRLDL